MRNDLIRVAILGLNLPTTRRLGDYEVTGIPIRVEPRLRVSFRLWLREGLTGVDFSRAVLKAEHIDDLYRSRDPHYIAFTERLLLEIGAYDIIVFSTFNPFHPELLLSRLSNKIKVLGFTDDPHATYTRGIPYLWAFDAAYYISPGYSDQFLFRDLFKALNYPRARWLPLVQPIEYPELSPSQIEERSIKVAYVGAPTGTKVDRLTQLDQVFGTELALHGRWRLSGYYGLTRALLGKRPLLRRVRPLSSADKERLYLNTMIGFNMHVSDRPAECGNMRTYENAAFGMMPLCDRAALNAQTEIFEEGREAIYYESVEDAIALIRHYTANKKDRVRVATAAHHRARAEYSWDKVTRDFLDWLVALPHSAPYLTERVQTVSPKDS
jgi:hypothetical protein